MLSITGKHLTLVMVLADVRRLWSVDIHYCFVRKYDKDSHWTGFTILALICKYDTVLFIKIDIGG